MIGLLVTLLGLLVLSGYNSIESGAQAGYPPTVPHSIENRQNCLMCHESGVMGATVTTHPERPNCVSCHVTQ